MTKLFGWAYNTWRVTGYEFVMVFFVLSGYFIGSSVLKDISADRWSWSKYLQARLTRLWVVLIPGLLLTLGWVEAQHHFFGDKTGFGPVPLLHLLSWKVFFGNLFFTQNILTPMYGNNGVLWSLNLEFWYYILFPCLILAFAAKTPRARILYGTIFVAIALFVGTFIMEYFLIWLVGVGVGLIPPRSVRAERSRFVQMLPSLLLFLFCLKIPYMLYGIPVPAGGYTWYFGDLFVALSFGVVAHMLLSFFNQSRTLNPRVARGFKALAGFSYTLYLTHLPMLNFLYAWKASQYWIGLNSGYVTIIFVVLALTYAYSIGRLTESHTGLIRRQVQAWLHAILSRRTHPQVSGRGG